MLNLSIETLIAVLIAYLIGSLSSAIIACKLFKLPDPRTQGSGNPGATNVLRFGGKKVAIITLLGDVTKGIVPVLLAKAYGMDTTSLALVAFAAFMGHLFPIFFSFRGGKGVATAFGCLAALSWPVGAALVITWITTAALFRYSSLAALITALLSSVYCWYLTNMTDTILAAAMTVLLIYRHRSNIRQLLAGNEKKISL